MAKIDLEKVLIALLNSPFNKQFDDKVKGALKEQGLEYKDGEIVEIQKPKFKVGDWVVYDGWTTQILQVCQDGYVNNHQGFIPKKREDAMRLWDITKDAKNGDILAVTMYPEGTWIGIFKEQNGCTFSSYCFLNTEGTFKLGTHNHGNGKAIHPATKEQRDLLFQKMKEAGYEWDNEKKELKKIEKTRPMLSDFFNAEYERGKASFANRQLYNRAILAILSNYVEKYPDIRFGQMLFNFDIKPHFNQESRETYWILNETINKRK